MLLTSCILKNFKSIANISLYGLQNLNCFIGPHNSGKTNILDGISTFFDPSQRAYLQHRQIVSSGTHVSSEREFDRNILTYLGGGKHIRGTFLFDIKGIREIGSRNEVIRDFVREIEGYSSIDQIGKLEWQLMMDSDQFTLLDQKLFLYLFKDRRIQVESRDLPLFQQAFGTTFFYRFPDNLNAQVSRLEANLSQLIKNNEYEHMAAIEDFLRDILDQQIVFEPSDGKGIEVTVEKAFTSPLSRISSSTQRLVLMSYVLTSIPSPRIILIDNPNLYLHPRGERKLAKRFINLDNKQIFLSTHSARLLIGNAFLVDLKKGFTRVRSIRGEKSMNDVVKLLGIRPSDSFGADIVIFVEGRTDARVYRAFEDIIAASTQKQSFPRNKVAYIGVGGWTNIRFALHLELLRSKFVRSRALAITDGDIKDSETYFQIKQNWSSVFSENSFFSLKEKSIESLFLNNPLVFYRKAEASGNHQRLPPVEKLKDSISKKRRRRSDKIIIREIIEKYFEKRYTSSMAEQLAMLFKVEEIPEYLASFFRIEVINT
ncbi:MAG: ATP-dependent endonuclease [Candidatus Thorarchaeota archaeon]